MKWYQKSFGEDYLLVYKHRNIQDAALEGEQIIRWLEIGEKDLILDLCCGSGRHTTYLANLGYHVVGFDLSKVLLARAHHIAGDLPVPFVWGDMRDLPFVDNSFHVVLNLFTSFGYFVEDKENQRVLKEVARILKPKGRFLFDFLNAASVKDRLVPESTREEDGVSIREKRYIEDGFVHKDIWITDGKSTRYYHERVKMYTESFLKAMMQREGLEVNQVYGSFDGEEYDDKSPRMIFVGTS